jgi:transcriptional regulator with XRE-family HTH domain
VTEQRTAAQLHAENAEARLRAALGTRVREARKQRNLSGRRLAALAGVTPSFISQIEQGQVSPSISTVLRIIHVLGITVGDLFDTHTPVMGKVLDPDEWEVYDLGASSDAVLALDPEQRIEVIWSTYPPGISDEDQPGTAHRAELQFVFVLRGEIHLRVGDRQHVLRERSSLLFDGRLPHFWSNPTSEPTELLSVLAPAI